MGGANSIVNVFDINSYHQEQLSAMKMSRERAESYDQLTADDGEPVGQAAQARGRFGVDMIVQKRKGAGGEDSAATDMVNNGRLKNFNEYEIQKYMQKDVKPIHLPDMPSYKRAQNEDPGQSSPRSQLETHIIKSLIISYFNTVRKSMNDMVPKTVMAFLVNKTKNLAQRELVSALYNDSVDLKQLLSEDNATVKKREACQEMVTTLRKSLEFLNEVRDFYFENDVGC